MTLQTKRDSQRSRSPTLENLQKSIIQVESSEDQDYDLSPFSQHEPAAGTGTKFLRGCYLDSQQESALAEVISQRRKAFE